jgi:hypothetical protein
MGLWGTLRNFVGRQALLHTCERAAGVFNASRCAICAAESVGGFFTDETFTGLARCGRYVWGDFGGVGGGHFEVGPCGERYCGRYVLAGSWVDAVLNFLKLLKCMRNG